MKTLLWYDRLQYLAMLFVAAALPLSWRLALLGSLLLAVLSLVKLIASRRVGNPALGWPLRLALLAAPAYWLLTLLGAFYGDGASAALRSAGLHVVGLKAGMLIFPLCFLLTDTSYLTPRLMRGLGHALVAAMCGVFLFHAGKALVGLSQGSALSVVLDRDHFDPRHHAYTSLYAATALAVAYHELQAHWADLRRWAHALLLSAAAMLVLYVMVVNSRAGVLAMGLVLAVAVVHQAVRFRRWGPLAVVAVLMVGAVCLMPSTMGRLRATMASFAADHQPDARTMITRSAMKVVAQKPLLGHGTGGYLDALRRQFAADGFEAGVEDQYNAHDQYLETLMSLGAVGLMLLLGHLLLPAVLAFDRRSDRRLLLGLVSAVFLLNLAFESMLERQAGLLFIYYGMAIMALVLSIEQNKFGQLGKSS